MFESLALSVLERVLGQYVENLDRNSLKVAVWRGHITLERLKLRREALYSWGLPLDIKAGYVEKIELQIPWNRLGSAPVTITLDGVYLVASPLDDETWDETAQAGQAQPADGSADGGAASADGRGRGLRIRW